MSQIEIPKGWGTKNILELTGIEYGKNLSRDFFRDTGYPVFGANGIIGYYNEFNSTHEEVLISCRGANSGKINMSPKKCFITNNSLVVKIKDSKILNKKFLFYALQLINKNKIISGSAQPQVTINNLSPIMISYPDIDVQEKIFEKLDYIIKEFNIKKELFLEMSNKNYLNNLNKLLTSSFFNFSSLKYCNSILLENLIEDARYGTSQKSVISDIGIPILRIPNIKTGEIDFSNLKFTKLTKSELEKLQLVSGDIVVCRTNGSLNLIGKAALIRETNRPFAFASYLIRLRPDKTKINPEYLNYFLASNDGKNHIQKLAKTSAGQYNINLPILRSLSIPIPDLNTQQKIVNEIIKNKQIIDNINSKILDSQKLKQHTLELIPNLIKSSLNEAFTGRLIN